MDGWWADFRAWLRSPFAADMNASHWFMFIGLLLVILFAWGLILATFRRQIGS